MSPNAHRIYIGTMTAIVVATFVFLAIMGYDYYSTPLEERFYHPRHDWFNAGGLLGHGLGIIGTLLILIGVVIYIAKKRYGFMAQFGRLKYWLEFHIFLCSLGPVMILFHTAFKFGGIVSIAFWSMVAVVLSGVIGRYIYIQIPHSIEGRQLSLQEVKDMQADLPNFLEKFGLSEGQIQAVLNIIEGQSQPEAAGVSGGVFASYFENRRRVGEVRSVLKKYGVAHQQVKQIAQTLRSELTLKSRISRLQTMQKLFRYWHVAHLPFALIMLVIVLLHVAITVAFGARWIF